MNSDLAGMTDSRYEVIKKMLEAGAIKKFTEIFEWIPHTVVAKDFKTSNKRMKQMTFDPTRWKLAEINKLAELLDYSAEKLAFMANKEAKEKENPGAN